MEDKNSEKCAIFIDGGYLNKLLEKIGKPSVDYVKFSEKICQVLKVSRLRTYYYNCLPFVRKGNKQDEIMKDKKEGFYNKLNRLPRFEVKLGELQMIGGKFKQKKIDVLMSLDIVDKCFESQIQHAIIIAGDSDFIPSIKKAKDYGAITHIFCHKDAVHEKLLDEIDETHYLTKDFFKDILL